MSFSIDIPLKLETEERDNNDNLLFDVDIKMEQETGTNDERDWSMSNFGSGELLEPLFFKHVTEAQDPQCALCWKYFPDRFSMLQHNLSHLQVTIVNPSIFRCDLCSSYFAKKQSMERHIIAHNRSKTNKLSYKPKSYNLTKYSIKLLRDGLTNSLSYKPKAFKTSLNSDRTHPCNICHKTYTYKAWHAHMHDVHGVGNFSCGICGVVFKCERYLKKHLTNVHIRKEPAKFEIKCDLCDTVLQSLNALTTHKRNVHSGTKHVCYICKSTLKCKSYLLAHMRRLHYSDGEKHECECGKSFRSRRYLMVHKRNSHSGKGKVKTYGSKKRHLIRAVKEDIFSE